MIGVFLYFLPAFLTFSCRTSLLLFCAVLSCVWLFVTPGTIAPQAPLSMEFSRQEHCSGLPFLPLGDLPDPGIKPSSLATPTLPCRFFTNARPWWLNEAEFLSVLAMTSQTVSSQDPLTHFKMPENSRELLLRHRLNDHVYQNRNGNRKILIINFSDIMTEPIILSQITFLWKVNYIFQNKK